MKLQNGNQEEEVNLSIYFDKIKKKNQIVDDRKQ